MNNAVTLQQGDGTAGEAPSVMFTLRGHAPSEIEISVYVVAG